MPKRTSKQSADYDSQQLARKVLNAVVTDAEPKKVKPERTPRLDVSGKDSRHTKVTRRMPD